MSLSEIEQGNLRKKEKKEREERGDIQSAFICACFEALDAVEKGVKLASDVLSVLEKRMKEIKKKGITIPNQALGVLAKIELIRKGGKGVIE